ncbi:MAG TPA: ABC transporter permease [Pyrinomonadaceae bacterium]|nr:ABC transporter permease [Pyrinomonadaceae bacterium]
MSRSKPVVLNNKKLVIVNEALPTLAPFDLKEIWVARELLYFLTWRDVKVRYKQTAMGALWAIIQPLFMMLIFAVFFGVFIGVPTDGMPYMLFFYCGLMPWTFFSTAVAASSVSLVSSSNLITKVYFPRVIVPAAAVGALMVDLLITLAILLGLGIYYGSHFTMHLAVLPFLIVLTILLAFEFGLWLSALTVRYRDIRHALPFVLQLWMFLTPIVYPLSVIPQQWRWLMYINPLTGVVEGMRSALGNHDTNWLAISSSVAVMLIMLPFSIYTFRRLEKSFSDLI